MLPLFKSETNRFEDGKLLGLRNTSTYVTFWFDAPPLMLVLSDFEQELQNHDGCGLILMDLGLFGLFMFLKKKCMNEGSWWTFMNVHLFFDFFGFFDLKTWKEKNRKCFWFDWAAANFLTRWGDPMQNDSSTLKLWTKNQ